LIGPLPDPVKQNAEDRNKMDASTAIAAPGFIATESSGKTLRLSDYKGRKNVVLVFNRGFS